MVNIQDLKKFVTLIFKQSLYSDCTLSKECQVPLKFIAAPPFAFVLGTYIIMFKCLYSCEIAIISPIWLME